MPRRDWRIYRAQFNRDGHEEKERPELIDPTTLA